MMCNSCVKFFAPSHGAIIEAPIATSENNVLMAWPNNDTGHWNVFFEEHRWRQDTKDND